MPSLIERARRARQHNTEVLPADPATEQDPVPSPTLAARPEPAMPQTAVPEDHPQPLATEPDAAATSTRPARTARTRTSGAWVAVIVAAVGLVFLLVFILQNLTRASVYFLGAAGTMPMGVAMLLAAATGALVVVLFGSARILQLRRTARRRH